MKPANPPPAADLPETIKELRARVEDAVSALTQPRTTASSFVRDATSFNAALNALITACLSVNEGAIREAWQPISTAPKGTWLEGPNDTRDPAYVEPPRVWLALEDGERCVGYADAYYAEGGSGYDGGSYWVENFSSERVKPTHWMPLPAAPDLSSRQKGSTPV